MKKRLVKKSWCFAIILLFVGASVVPSVMSGDTEKVPAVTIMDGEWYVKEGGNNSNSGESWEDALANISEAVKRAKNGDTIYVGNGTYYENVVIGKQLIIVGNGSSVTTIDGGGVGNVIGVHYPGVTITKFNITNSGPLNGAGIYGYYSDNCVIIKNIIEKNHRGIRFYFGKSSEIKENVIQDNSWGIQLDGAYTTNIEDNWISSNMRCGIALEDVQECYIKSNLIKNNFKWGGLLLYDSVDGISRLNEIRENNFISNGEKDFSHIICRSSQSLFSSNYYEPTHLFHLGFFFRIYVVWGALHRPQFPELYLPMIAGIDTSKATGSHSIPYPIP